jgi:hypothetical protein
MPELRKLNYYRKKDTKLDIDPGSIPTLIPKTTLAEWQQGDEDPYYKIQEIEYPIVANGINYLESFFKSFISKLKKRPIPGSKSGHSMWSYERPSTDFIMVGAKLESNGDGTGKVFFKNYIPPEGAGGSNETFIKENKSDMVHYSLVSYTEDNIYADEDGNQKIDVVKSVKGERNDAVEYGLGAMEQKTNIAVYNPYPNEHSARIKNPDSFEKDSFRRKKIETGISIIIGRLKGETTTTTQAYRFSIKNFTATEAKKWLKDHDIKYISFEPATEGEKENKQGAENMTKDEIFEKLKTLKANADITLIEIAGVLGMKDHLITDEHREAVKVFNKLKENGIENPVSEIEKLQNQIKINADSVRDAVLDKQFGPDTDEKNYLRQYAAKECRDFDGDDLLKKINEILKDPIAKKLAADKADYTTDCNTVGVVEKTEKDKALNINGRRIDRY